jgi:hypothetical protein
VNAPSPRAGSASSWKSLSAWAWEASLWRANGADLLRQARKHAVDQLFVTLAIEDGRLLHRQALTAFLAGARSENIAVTAVEGDPVIAWSKSALRSAVRRAEAIRAFRATAGGAGLAGVQYDVEPYVAPHWQGAKAEFTRWGDALSTLAAALGEPIDAVLPFWVAEGRYGRAMLERSRGSISMVTIMAYRSDAPEIERISAPLVEWARSRSLQVRLALECSLDQPPNLSFRGNLAAARAAAGWIAARRPAQLHIALHGLQWRT